MPLPFLHVSLACPVKCFLRHAFATRVSCSWGLLLCCAYSMGLCFSWAVLSIVGASSFFLACFYSCCSLCFGAAYFLRHVGVVLLFSLSPSTSMSFVSVASLPTWAAPSAPPPIRAIFFFPFWISFCSYPFHLFSLVSSKIYRCFSRRAFLASVGSVLFIVVLICSFPFLFAGVAGYGHYPLLSLIVPALWTFAPPSPHVLPSYRSWGSSRISSIGTNQISSSACAPPPLVPKRRPSPAASRHRGAPTSLLPAPLYWS